MRYESPLLPRFLLFRSSLLAVCVDDGNSMDLDGCNPTCHFEYCGDSTTNNNGLEECDGGGAVDSADCDSDCTFVECDGHVNFAAGESCDGNGADTANCDS